jgi:hypothetical protein
MLAITIAEADINARYEELRKWAMEFRNTPRLVTGRDVIDLPEYLRARVLKEVRLYQLSSGISEREKLLRFLEGVKKRLAATTTLS